MQMIPLHQQTIDAAEIAAALGYTSSYFLRLVSSLTDRHGMPQRLPGRKRWSRPAIEQWLKSYGATTTTPAQTTLPPTIAAQRQALHEAYAEARA
ncbi:hypothetical protein [Agrobacterium vitis]|uniref:hypothetical protein n=1 Tax=Agrobacterium vitis TaxID=373 RepID=UPI0012E9754E|nr:hypothetical protein [Agrobacterium vitis]MVA33632.1 hypothetical protein [Agrobacterium vitis]